METEPGKLDKEGFRNRGGEVTRVEAFVDAAFAFALTMLVISVGDIPHSTPDLLDALKGTPAFAASFAQIAMFWYAHVTWSRRYGMDDFPSTLLSLVLVFIVMVYVYPLKALFATFFGWISGGWLPRGFEFHTMSDLSTMFIVYGVVFGTMCIIVSLLYIHAWRKREMLGLSLDEQVATSKQIARWVVPVLIAIVSVSLAFGMRSVTPGWYTSLPGMIYSLMFLIGPIPERVGARTRRHLVEAGTGAHA